MKRILKQSKLYVIRKYVSARSAAEAIRKDKDTPVDDVWLSEKAQESREEPPAIGFLTRTEADDWV
jgi:hypothetical protein